MCETSADCVEIGVHFRRNLQRRSLKILAKMPQGRRSRNQQNVGRALEKPSKRNLHRRGVERRRGRVECRRLQRTKASQREKRNVSYALRGKVNDEAVIFPVCHIVEVLNAHYLCHGLSLSQLPGSNVAQTDMTDQSLTLEFREHGQRLLDRSFRWFREPSNAEIHDVESVETKISKIVINAIDEFLARQSRNPGLVFTPAGTDLGDDQEICGIRMKRPLDKLIGDMRAVVVAGIDVVHTRINGLAQNSDCSVNVTGWSPHLRTSELHCAVPNAVYGYRCARQRKATGEMSLFNHSVFS